MDVFKFFSGQRQDLQTLIIESERLQLVTISDQFEQNIFQEFTCEITRYMFPSPPEEIEETRNFITESRRSTKAGNNLQFIILSKETDEFLGCCGLHGADKVRTPELGIWLKKSAHWKRYGREAIHLLVDWAKKNIDLDYFLYPVDRRNVASYKIPESLGGERIQEGKRETATGKILELVTYKINR
jgi:[ribosomal protein S5]-alanine N-acetyltransferase